MKSLKFSLSLLLLLLIFTGCSHQIVRSGYYVTKSDYKDCNIRITKVISPKDSLIKLGTVKLGDSGFSMTCSEEDAMNILRKEGCAMNADIVYITHEKYPDLLSSCYRCTAEFYKATSREKKIAGSLDWIDPLKGKFDQATVAAERARVVSVEAPRFRISANYGWSKRLARLSSAIPSDLKKYSKNLMQGATYNLDFNYFFSEQYGVGIKYENFRTKEELQNVTIQTGEYYWMTGTLKDDISITFVGPVLSFRTLYREDKGCFTSSIGLGYMGYTDDGVYITGVKATGSTFGTYVDLGYEQPVSDHWRLVAQVSLLSGTLTRYKYTDQFGRTETLRLDKDNYDNLSRMDLTLGLRYCW